MKTLNSRRPIASIGLALLVAGAGLIARPVAHGVIAQISAAQAKGIWQKWKKEHAHTTNNLPSKPGDPVCWLRVPSCKISTLATQESDAEALYRFPAIRQTGSGGCVVYAHRDVHFRGLANVRTGDEITMELADGSRTSYTVRSIRIVLPEQVSAAVDNPENRDPVHLLTCYPFQYIGAAPKRFLVTATRRGR